MKKLQNIQAVNDAEVELIKRQSSLLLQKKSNGFNGELRTSGTIVENFIKGIISKHIPYGYRICSGYIATTDTINDSDNLIQHDLVIIDSRIPSLYKFGVSDIEIVSAESVCGVIEIKRTLTKDSLKSAIEHLNKTKELLEKYDGGIKSKTKAANNAAGPTLSVATRAPLYAIIGLNSDKNSIEESFVISEISKSVFEFIDLIWSLSDGFLIRFTEKSKTDGQIYLPLNVSRNLSNYDAHCYYDYFKEEENGEIYRLAISMMRTWINNTSGSPMDALKNQKYFGLL